MTLIIIALALVCERLLTEFRRWREYNWLGVYLERLQDIGWLAPLWRSAWGLLLILPVLGGVLLLQILLQGGLLTVAGLVFSFVMLVFSLGPRDLWEEVRSYIAAVEQGDTVTADRLAADLCAAGGRRPDSARGRSVVNAVVIQGNERLFGVLLWFFVLGPVGAVLYRLAAEWPTELRKMQASEGLVDIAMRLHGLVAWIPIRVSALLYGLAGDTDGALTGWRTAAARPSQSWFQQGWQCLAGAGGGALTPDYDDDHPRFEQSVAATLSEALSLVTRSLVILLGALAAFTIGGWIA